MGLVVEHFLEVGDKPAVIDGIAVKTAAEVVVHAAFGHLAEGEGGHFERFGVLREGVIAQEEVEDDGPGELGGGAEAAEFGIEGTAEVVEGGFEGVGVQDARIGADFGGAGDFGDDGFAGSEDLVAFGEPGLIDLLEDGGKAGTAIAGVGGEIGAAEEGFQVGSEPDGHGPPAGPGGGLDEGHVDAVHVGAFLAVDLDGDEVAVEQGADGLVFERFSLHDVAPVAGGVADGEEDGLVFRAGFGESLLAPGVPIDGIVGVLEQVWAFFVNEAIDVHYSDSEKDRDS